MSALTVPARTAEPMSHRQTLEALSGLLLVLFVALLSSTVVSTALPQIIGALRGSQTQYTWVVTATCSPRPRPRRSGASWPTCSTRSCSSRSRS